MAQNAPKTAVKERPEQTEIVILDDETEEEIGVASAASPPVPQVGDLVSLTNFATEGRGPGAEDQTRGEDSISFRVTDRAVHYEMSETDNGEETQLLTEVLLYVVSKEEWAARRQRGT